MLPERTKTLLIVSQATPSDTGMGVAMRLGNWVEKASKDYRITLVIVSADPECRPEALAERWRTLCEAFQVVNVSLEAQDVPHGRIMRRLFRVKPALWDRWPVRAVRCGLQPIQGMVPDAAAPFDTVLVFRLRLWPVWQELRSLGWRAKRQVLDLDDVESEATLRQIKALGSKHFGRVGVWLERLEVFRLRFAQRNVLNAVDALTLASPEDVHLLGLAPLEAAKVLPIPNAVRLPLPLPLPLKVRSCNNAPTLNLLFLGAMNYLPNEQAVKWWVRSIQPLLNASLGKRSPVLQVVGRHPPPWMQSCRDFELHADVPSVEPYFKECDALVVPLLTGGGTRIKILEAMAYGRPIISTSVGAEGLGLQAGVHYLQADTPQEFVQAVIALQGNDNLARAMTENCLALVKERFSLEVVGQHMLQCLDGHVMPSLNQTTP